MVDTLYSTFGQQFQIASKMGDEVHPSARRKNFRCPISCKAFITRDLKANTRYWRRFLQFQRSIQSPQHQLTDHQVLDGVVVLVLRGSIRFYELPNISETVMAHNGLGTGYNFIKGPQPLPCSDAPVLTVNSEEQAYEIINGLKGSDNFWPGYLKKHELVPAQDQSAALKSYQTDITGYVAGLIASGELIVYSRAYAPPPPPASVDKNSLNYASEFFVDKPMQLRSEKKSYERVEIDFQIDVDVQKNRNDVMILTHNESDYESSIVLGNLWEFDRDWVRLSYADPPPSGSYTLVHNPKDGEPSYIILENVPYASLKTLLPEAEDVVIYDEAQEEENEAAGNTQQGESVPA